MNTIDECVYGREPAESQLKQLRRQAAEKAQWQRDYEQLMREHREAPELAGLLEDFVKRGDELYKDSGWPAILQPALGPARALLARIKEVK